MIDRVQLRPHFRFSMCSDTIYIITESANAQIEIKKSVFLACASPLKNSQSVKQIILDKRKEHPRARHVVWAFIIGQKNSQTMGLSDDGEPQGTAGRPILNILERENITNTIITVVRYFGGTKLGKGPLARAYANAASSALEKAHPVELINKIYLNLNLDYDLHKTVLKIIKSHNAEIISTQYDSSIHIQCETAEQKASIFTAELINTTNNRIIINEHIPG